MRDFVALVVGDWDSGHLITPFFFKLSDFKIGPERAFEVAVCTKADDCGFSSMTACRNDAPADRLGLCGRRNSRSRTVSNNTRQSRRSLPGGRTGKGTSLGIFRTPT